MTMRVRAILMLMAALAMMSLAGCGHYICGAGDLAHPPARRDRLLRGGTHQPQLLLLPSDTGRHGRRSLRLNTSAGTFGRNPQLHGTDHSAKHSGEGSVVAQGQYLYTLFSGTGQIYGFTISSTGGLTAMTDSPFSAAYLNRQHGRWHAGHDY